MCTWPSSSGEGYLGANLKILRHLGFATAFPHACVKSKSLHAPWPLLVWASGTSTEQRMAPSCGVAVCRQNAAMPFDFILSTFYLSYSSQRPGAFSLRREIRSDDGIELFLIQPHSHPLHQTKSQKSRIRPGQPMDKHRARSTNRALGSAAQTCLLLEIAY